MRNLSKLALGCAALALLAGCEYGKASMPDGTEVSYARLWTSSAFKATTPNGLRVDHTTDTSQQATEGAMNALIRALQVAPRP